MRPRGQTFSSRLGRTSLLAAQGGGVTVEKIILVATVLGVVALGVSRLGVFTRETLTCQGEWIESDGVRRCGSGPPNPGLPGPAAAGGLPSSGEAAPPGRPPGTCRGPFCMCFVTGTPVVTEAGERPIETIEPGTLVLSRDENGDQVAWKAVRAAFRSRARSLVELTFAGAGSGPEVITATGGHPFHSAARGWRRADQLLPGEAVEVSASGAAAVLLAARSLPADDRPVYNLEVADYHTYFVGRLGLWVHNQNFFKRKLRPALAKMKLKSNNPVGKVITVKVDTGVGPPKYVSATVTGVNGNLFEVQWTEGGQTFTGLSDVRGKAKINPPIGSRPQITAPDGTKYDVLIIGRNPDLSSEFEGNWSGVHVSGTLSPDGSFTLHPDPPAKTRYTGGPIGGLPVQFFPAQGGQPPVTQIGNNIQIFHPNPNAYAEDFLQEAAENFAKDTLDNLATMAQHPSGAWLLDQLENAGGPGAQPVQIAFTPGYDYLKYGGGNDTAHTIDYGNYDLWNPIDGPAQGAGATIQYNPSIQGLPIRPSDGPEPVAYDDFYLPAFQQGFGRAVNQPSDVTLFYELMMADMIRKGMAMPSGATFGGSTAITGERALGLGDFSAFPSVNSYRQERGLPNQPFVNQPGERFSTAAMRGFAATDYVNSNSGAPGAPAVTATGDRRYLDEEWMKRPWGEAYLHVNVSTSHNHPQNVIRDLGTGHTWISLEVTDPLSIPKEWRQKYPYHYVALINEFDTPLGYHLGFFPPQADNFVGVARNALMTQKGYVVMETGRDLRMTTAVQSYPLTMAQLENVLKFVDDTRAGSKYKFSKNNCTDWTKCALTAAGVSNVPTKLNYLGLASPNRLRDQIAANEANAVPGALATKLVHKPNETMKVPEKIVGLGPIEGEPDRPIYPEYDMVLPIRRGAARVNYRLPSDPAALPPPPRSKLDRGPRATRHEGGQTAAAAEVQDENGAGVGWGYDDDPLVPAAANDDADSFGEGPSEFLADNSPPRERCD